MKMEWYLWVLVVYVVLALVTLSIFYVDIALDKENGNKQINWKAIWIVVLLQPLGFITLMGLLMHAIIMKITD